jgi:transposase
LCLDLSYQEIMSSQDPKFAVRYQMVMSALSKGIRPTMREFRCSRNTVRLWLRRYEQQGLAGLEERSRAPHHIPHKTPPEVEQQVVEARDAIPCFGPRRLKRYFDLPCSTGAIARILQQSGRSQRRKKPRPRARSLAAEKLSWPAFGLLQVDVKDLSDLPGYRELIPFGLPRYQFTARIVPEGGIWLAFSAVNDSTYALLFGDRLLAHLAACGVKLEELTVQTDNGSEFGGAWNRRRTPPAFTRLVEQKYCCRQHRFNPPHRSTYNSDVEAVHGLMEQEFYQLEPFRGDLQRFLNLAWTYQLWFNYLRENSAKGHRTPDQLRAERAPWVHAKVYALPPVLLSSLSAQDLPSPRQILGQDLPGHVTCPRGRMLLAPGRRASLKATWIDLGPSASEAWLLATT